MKVRKDFVTNSSSSSYVIAFRSAPEFDKETIDKYPFLAKFGEFMESILLWESQDTHRGDVVKTKEELDKYIVDRYGLRDQTLKDVLYDDDYARYEYERALEALENGKYILFKSVDYSDTCFEEMLKGMSSSGFGIDIISSD